jgi:hypothetical protein
MNTPYIFEPGQQVTLAVNPKITNAVRGAYRVVQQLPPRGDDNQYRIKSELERHERVVTESQLARMR